MRLRVGIVGVGPKGLFCLERLIIELTRLPPGSLEIHLFEPHPTPGAGPVYDPRQSRHLRMNLSNESVDMWSRDEGERSIPGPRPNLVEWMARTHPRWADPDAYSPRALVGEYLNEGFRRIVDAARRGAAIRLHSRRVHRVAAGGGAWSVHADPDSVTVDEVVLATGHASRHAQSRPGPHPRVISGVYPVSEFLAPARIPPGSTVALRGFGLSALDAILTLCLPRGGLAPRRILPFSRSGRPMVPKLDPRCSSPVPGAARAWLEGSSRMEDVRSASCVEAVLSETAARALVLANGKIASEGAALARVEEHLGFLLNQTTGRFRDEPAEAALARGMQVARGEREWDSERALGEAWRELHPALVRRLGSFTLPETGWLRLRRLVCEMERLAFGPPPGAARVLLDLVRSGRVDLTALDGPEVDIRESEVVLVAEQCTRRADLLIDAVLDPPGAAPHGSALLSHLLDAGHARIVPGTAGVEVAPDGSAVGRDGSVTRGLAIIGRPTEGKVLGNDTLSRGLHDHPARWAERVADRARREQRVAP